MEKLSTYFKRNYGVENSTLMGLRVQTKDGEQFYITDFDQMCDSKSLPRTLFISKTLGSNFGNTISSDELFVPLETKLKLIEFVYVEVVSFDTDKVVNRIDVTKNSERSRERVENGLNINLNHDKYFTRIQTYSESKPKED